MTSYGRGEVSFGHATVFCQCLVCSGGNGVVKETKFIPFATIKVPGAFVVVAGLGVFGP